MLVLKPPNKRIEIFKCNIFKLKNIYGVALLIFQLAISSISYSSQDTLICASLTSYSKQILACIPLQHIRNIKCE